MFHLFYIMPFLWITILYIFALCSSEDILEILQGGKNFSEIEQSKVKVRDIVPIGESYKPLMPIDENCHPKRFGGTCRLRCRCNDTSNPCDPDCRLCQDGYSASPYCQRENVAFRRSAKLSSDINSTLLTDGDRSTCVEVTPQKDRVWIVLPLGRHGNAREVWLFAKDDMINGSVYLSFRELKIDSLERNVDAAQCWKSSGPTTLFFQNPTVFPCVQTLRDTAYVFITKYTESAFVVCEIEVHVCSVGTYGRFCEKECNCRTPGDPCDSVTGLCAYGCKLGYHGNECDEVCEPGTYGYNCLYNCNCLNKAEICDRATGFCASGCPPRTHGPNCIADEQRHRPARIIVAEPQNDGNYYGTIVGCVLALVLVLVASTYLTVKMNREMKMRVKKYKTMKRKAKIREAREIAAEIEEHAQKDPTDIMRDTLRKSTAQYTTAAVEEKDKF